jgi:hypothetical protein
LTYQNQYNMKLVCKKIFKKIWKNEKFPLSLAYRNQHNMKLEVRNSKGQHMVTFKGEFATRMYHSLNSVPELIKTKKPTNRGTFVVFEVVAEDMGYTFSESVTLVLLKGDYIKILQ